MPSFEGDPQLAIVERYPGRQYCINQQALLTERNRWGDLPRRSQPREPEPDPPQHTCEAVLYYSALTDNCIRISRLHFAQGDLFGPEEQLDAGAFVMRHLARNWQAQGAKVGLITFGSANQHSTGSQKCRDEQSARPGVKVLCRAYLEDAAALDYCDAVGQLKGFLLIVSHQDRGDSELLL